MTGKALSRATPKPDLDLPPGTAVRERPASTRLDEIWQAHAANPAPMYLADATGRPVFRNEAYSRIARFLPSETDELGLDEVDAAVRALGRPLSQDLVVNIDGELEYYSAERSVIRDAEGAPIGVLARFSPVEGLRRTEDALFAAEDRLADITRLVSDWVWETDETLALRYVSPRVFDRLGYHPKELVTRTLVALAQDSPELDRALAASPRRPFYNLRVVIPHRQGEWRRFQLSAVPTFAPDTGEFRGFRGTAQDITDRDAQHAALLKAADEAEAANRAKTEFLANMSHELRTPLNAIMGFSEIMKLEALGPIGLGKYKEYAGDILESSRHLLKLINDILDIAKIEAGRVELDEGMVGIGELLQGVQRVMTEAAQRAGVAIDMRIAPGLPSLWADERRLRQVLLNLLSNAVKFTLPGGRIAIEAWRAASGALVVTVRDTGIGMRSEDIAVAMAPFGQIDSGLGRRYEGTGLGLPLSKALIELHGGTFKLESEPGVGTTVILQFPPDRVRED